MTTSSFVRCARNAGVAAGLSSAVLAAGCTTTVTAREPVIHSAVVVEEDVVYVDEPPARVEAYPVEVYGGVNVYLVEGRWYRRAGGRWQVYRTEPVELGRRRAVIERRSPPRHERREERREERR